MDVSEQVARVDDATVTSVARQALGRPVAKVARWEHEFAYGGYGVVRGTNCLLRVSGVATEGKEEATWSAYLKLTRVPPTDQRAAWDLTHNDYWRREIATYESDIPNELPDGMATPRCYAVVDAGEAVHLWLEDVREDAGPWSMERYGLAGRHLGRLSGQYLAGRPLPDYPWLNRDFLRRRADRNAPFWARIDEIRTNRFFPAMFPGDTANQSRALFEQRHSLLGALDRLPQTLSHQDADRRNLLGRVNSVGARETVAIDWAFTGVGPVGAEAAALAVSSVLWWKGVGPDDLSTLDAHVFEGYLAGLRDAGWRGNAEEARFGYVATVALRYGPLLGVNPLIEANETQRAAIAQTVGQSFEDGAARYGQMLPYVMQRADEARRLLASLT